MAEDVPVAAGRALQQDHRLGRRPWTLSAPQPCRTEARSPRAVRSPALPVLYQKAASVVPWPLPLLASLPSVRTAVTLEGPPLSSATLCHLT